MTCVHVTSRRRRWRPLLAAAAALLLAACAAAPPAADHGQADLRPAADAWRAGNYAKALPLLQNAASNGNARAQYALGYMYYHGQGVTRNMDTALAWIRKAADNGDKRAIEALGTLAGAVSREGRARRGMSDGTSDQPSSPAEAPPASGKGQADGKS